MNTTLLSRMGRACGTGLIGALGFATAVLGQGQGYRLTREEVVVDSRSHWENWTYPAGTLTITPEGQVRPRQLRKDVNAMADVLEHRRLHSDQPPEGLSLLDAIQGGSNREGVVRVMDGDPATYWEPDRPSGAVDLASQWWFTVDLGRLVFAKKIVVRFVEEGEGDPFLLFDVLISDGVKPSRVPNAVSPEFRPVLRMLQPNKSQRLFEIDLQGGDEELEATGMRYVQVVVTGSDLERGREVSQEEYGQLADADRGAVEYHKRLLDGREVVVEPGVYAQLEAERRGSVRYYRWERPRLAEVEVWSEGDEILSGMIARGGYLALSAKEAVNLGAFIDGDVESNSNMLIGVSQNVADPDRYLIFDLGSFYWIDSQRMAFGRGVYRGSFANYRLEVSDGSRAADGSLYWQQVVDRKQAQVTTRPFQGNDFEPVKARFFRVGWTVWVSGLGVVTLAEMQLYGSGYQPEVWLESDLIRLGGSRNLLTMGWEGETPAGTQIRLQTRTGNELGQVLHYYKKDGSEVTEAQYKKLLSIFKGEIVAEEVEGSDWSDWSEGYTESTGSAIRSPSPREYLKIRATLVSSEPEVGAGLRSLRLRFVEPVAQRLVGEVMPVEVDSLGVERGFSLYVRPQFGVGDPGFDELLLVSPPDMRLGYEGLYGGKEGELGSAAEWSGWSLAGVEVVPTGGDSLRVRFERVGRNAGVELLRLDFRTALYGTGTQLQASLKSRAAGEGSWQRVDVGDATGAVGSNSMTLMGRVERKGLISRVRVVPRVFTPNGDGVNEEVAVAFSVVLVGASSPVGVAVYDLGGRRVRDLEERREVSTGEYGFAWDGRDESGGLVAPGVYCLRLTVGVDTQGSEVDHKELLRTVAVAY